MFPPDNILLCPPLNNTIPLETRKAIAKEFYQSNKDEINRLRRERRKASKEKTQIERQK